MQTGIFQRAGQLARRQWLLALLGMAASGAFAQGATTGRPLSLIVPFTAGGASDIGARMLAPELSRLLGQTVVVENLPGAGGALAIQKLIRAEPDGNTLLYGGISETLLVPMINKAVGYKPEDLQPIALAGSSPIVIAVRPDFPAESIDDLVALVRRQPGKFSYGSAGIGSFAHVMGEAIKEQAGLFMVHIPYRGGQQVVSDVIGGQLDMAITTAANVMAMYSAKRVKLLGISSPARVDAMKDVPTFAESRSLKGLEMSVWALMLAPKGTPAALQERLSNAINTALMLPAMRTARQRLASDLPSVMNPAQASAFLAQEQARYRSVTSRIKPE